MMNTFGTRCPTCLTAFKVHSDLLLLNNGYGTCGQCGSVFDMKIALFILPPHAIKFVVHVTQANHDYPVLSAVVIPEDESSAAKEAVPELQPAVSLQTSLNQLSSQNFAENISIQIKPTDTTTEVKQYEPTVPEQKTAMMTEPKPEKNKEKWLIYTNVLLLILLLAQTAVIFSREINQNIPQTKAVFEQLNLLTESK